MASETRTPEADAPLILLNRPFHPLLHPLFMARFPNTRICDDFMSLPADVKAQVRGIALHGHVKVDGALLDAFPGVRVVSNHGVGLDHVKLADATARGIPVGYTPDVLSAATADMAMALLLAISRRVVAGHALAVAPDTRTFASFGFGTEVTGATIGILGMGRIGQAVAQRAHHGFNMRVLYHNRSRVDAAKEASVRATYCESACALARESDFLVVCAPGDSGEIVTEAVLRSMKPSAFLINVSRGSLVNQPALAAALRACVCAGAALDVTDPEPLPRDHELLEYARTHDNLIITPHTGSATLATREAMLRLLMDNLSAGVCARALSVCANPEAQAHPRV